MGACCCCFPSKPPRENPMHPTAEPLIQRKPNHTPPYHQRPPVITHAHKGMNAVVRLKTGFERFRTNVYNKNPKLFESLRKDQSPKYMVFACADSRVSPTITLGLNPGEAFTVRNIAGMVPAYQKTRHCSVGSAIEFALVVLKVASSFSFSIPLTHESVLLFRNTTVSYNFAVECIVVIGHSRCGGIRELLSLNDEGPNAYHFIEDWVKIGMEAKKKVQRENRLLPFDDQCTVLEKEAVNISLRNLKSYPFVKDRLNKGTLNLIGARYDFVRGSFETWNA
ncbi:unnamed protein product [Triticum turgidum subsp. durum]|uniref:Carbonic anhydrase n=1 Tax=Triticum turgidum subsp. durum TaxID=4567 RepID=A0A9R1QI01_TRITD|nr:unnamed protein product [Triticum turgidum subsp. durum]